MRIRIQHAFIFLTLSILSILIWYQWTYPQFSFINLSVDQHQAKQIAKDYLRAEYGLNPDQFIAATVFSGRPTPDRYLQKALGFDAELKFLHDYSYELFFWETRFFRENQEEQFTVLVSAATGEVSSFTHTIKETEERPDHGKEKAREKAIAFLEKRFGFNPDNYNAISNLTHVYDNRSNHSFSWALKDVYLPWSKNPQEGGAKLLTGVTVCGDEILSFYKNKLDIPNEFSRYMARIQNTGKNLLVLVRLLYFGMICAATFFVIARRTSLILNQLKKKCLIITAGIFLLELLLYLNGFEYLLFDYPTTSSFRSYFWRFFSNQLLEIFMMAMVFLLPVLAGESLHYEVFPKKRDRTFLHYFRTTFLSRETSALIVIGYSTAIIMFGLQSFVFHFGQRFFGVWSEQRWMTNFTGSYIPFLAPFIVAITASINEETMFRLFSISLGKKILHNTWLAVITASIVWGFCHSNYPVYPMWFRGIEVSMLGILLSIVYLNFGIIPVLVAHYLFNAFWGSSNFLLGHIHPSLFFSSLTVLILPLAWAIIAFLKNKKATPVPMVWHLSQHQCDNAAILRYYLQGHPNELTGHSREEVVSKFVDRGWDIAIIETILTERELSE